MLEKLLIAIGSLTVLAISGLAALSAQVTTGQPQPSQPSTPKQEKALIVLIPGFAGSTLYTCPSKEAQLYDCVLIYGDDNSGATRQDLAPKDGAIYKVGPLQFSSKKMYDDLLVFLTDYVKKPEAKPFEDAEFIGEIRAIPYDWRLSIVDAAKQLDMRLCQLAATEGPMSLYVIAHSMGGLVIKQWLYTQSTQTSGCRDKILVKAVAFVGSPLLGATETINDLLAGLHLTTGPTSWFEEVSPSLTQSALWLPGAYDLLPIRGSPECLKNFPDSLKDFKDTFKHVSPPIVLKAPSGTVSDGPEVDVYASKVWLDLHFLRYPIQKGYQIPSMDFIASHLKSSEDTACQLLKFDVGKLIPEGPWYYDSYVYVASKQKNTVSQIEFDSNPDKAFRNGQPDEKGDGTVPWYSASFLDNKHTRNVDSKKGDQADHYGILASGELKEQFRVWLKDRVFWRKGEVSTSRGCGKS